MPGRFEYERAIRRSDLQPLSRLLALTIATWADVNTGVIPPRYQPALSVLMEATGISKGSLLKHRSILVDGGWLSFESPDIDKARRDHARSLYRIHVPAWSVTDHAQSPQDGHGESDARSATDHAHGQPLTMGHGQPPTTRVPTSTKKSQPARSLASESSESQIKTAAYSSLRSEQLPFNGMADRQGPEGDRPEVGTATIPEAQRDFGGRGKTAAEIEIDRKQHNQQCRYCQQGPKVCDTAAGLVRQWIRAVNREAS